MANLVLNGKAHTVDAPREMPLLWAIRDVVGLTGLTLAAAGHMKVPVGELSTEPHSVVHKASGRNLGYGDVAEFADFSSVTANLRDSRNQSRGLCRVADE
jgi:hypothetical protein